MSALGGGAYHASKFAIEAFAYASRPEVEPFGVDVVSLGRLDAETLAVILVRAADSAPMKAGRSGPVASRCPEPILDALETGCANDTRSSSQKTKLATAMHSYTAALGRLDAFSG